KDRKWSIGQKKTCRKKQHVRIDDMKEMSDLIYGKAAVGGNYNSTRDNWSEIIPDIMKKIEALPCNSDNELIEEID
ncbi:MAG: hypothetical protein J6C00_14345, partial [Eubacterium sp.]|nr:hypothetical protein [Eubacterium sp.]